MIQAVGVFLDCFFFIQIKDDDCVLLKVEDICDLICILDGVSFLPLSFKLLEESLQLALLKDKPKAEYQNGKEMPSG